MARVQKPAFWSVVEVKIQRLYSKCVGICRRASLFSFWAIGIVVFRTLYFWKKTRTQLSHKSILFEMKLRLSSAASSLLHEVNFK